MLNSFLVSSEHVTDQVVCLAASIKSSVIPAGVERLDPGLTIDARRHLINAAVAPTAASSIVTLAQDGTDRELRASMACVKAEERSTTASTTSSVRNSLARFESSDMSASLPSPTSVKHRAEA